MTSPHLDARPQAGVPALTVHELSHAFDGVPVLDGVSLSVASRRVTAVVGPSGGGKSTLFRVLAGLLIPASGTAEVHGVSVVGKPGHVAFMPQRDHLLPWRRALGNAVLGAQIRGVPVAEARSQAQALFPRFGLEGTQRQWPGQLSGGMRQRLALLRTFLVGRDVLLLDEPFGALDAMTRRSMHAWVQEVLAEDPRAVLLITHDVEEALLLADDVVVLSRRPARVLATFSVLFDRPRVSTLVGDARFVALKSRVLSVLDDDANA